MMRRIKRAVLFLLLWAVALSSFAYAAERPDFKAKCSLTIDFSYDDLPVADAEFRLFRVGEISKDFTLSLSGAYKKYPVVVDGLDDVQFQKAADTLEGYVTLDGHKPMKVVTTNRDGQAKVEKLSAGLYLMTGVPVKTDAGSYIVENQLIILPYAENTAEEWIYDLTITPKAEFVPVTTEPLKLQVIKIWDDKASGGIHRPKEVTVHLLRDGEKFETVVLNEATSWRHEWTDLDPAYNWSVTEDVPVDYTVTITLEGFRFIVTNTCKKPPPPTPTPPPIPQTGQLWWPVPVLLLLGGCLVAMGLVWRKDEDET